MIQKENSFGTFDQEINAFFKDAHHFACLINTCLYQGQEIVKPENLMLVDPKIQAYTRDVLMLWNGRYGSYYLGIENQLIENYPMPYRILQYDCLVYKDQMDILEKEHRKKKDLRSSEEFLSGIKEEDKNNRRERGITISRCNISKGQYKEKVPSITEINRKR